jgi:ParB family chromosome partitioning protein
LERLFIAIWKRLHRNEQVKLYKKWNNNFFKGQKFMESQICKLQLKDIIVSETGNPRKEMGQLFDLGDSMQQVGQLAPVIVNHIDDKMILIAGERRLRAAKEAGLAFVEAKVYENLDAVTAVRMTLAENKYKPLNPIEEAKGMQMLVETGGYTIKQVAREFNMAQETVKRKLDLLTLPDDIQKMMTREENRLPVHQAIEVLRLKDESKMREAAKAIAPSTGPVMNESEAKKLIEEKFKPKEAKLVDEEKLGDVPDPAGSENNDDKKETPVKETKTRSLGDMKPVAVKIFIEGKLFATSKDDIEVLKATVTMQVKDDSIEVPFDRIKLPFDSRVLKLIKNGQKTKKAEKSKSATLGELEKRRRHNKELTCPNKKCSKFGKTVADGGGFACHGGEPCEWECVECHKKFKEKQ